MHMPGFQVLCVGFWPTLFCCFLVVIGWIKICIESSTVAVLVNGNSTQEIKSSRGLTQGNPMTSFLFLIVAAGLVRLVRQVTKKQLYQGVKDWDKRGSSKLTLICR